jgi:hypothetical protein
MQVKLDLNKMKFDLPHEVIDEIIKKTLITDMLMLENDMSGPQIHPDDYDNNAKYLLAMQIMAEYYIGHQWGDLYDAYKDTGDFNEI